MAASKKQLTEAEVMEVKDEALTEGNNEAQEEAAVLVLKGAAALVSGGVKFVKEVPRQVENQELARRLMASGLFEAGGKR
ncbi:MAG: hypothetical protein HPY90_04530 [Syntrophothermus sp.]|uniref:hypothetical protein n=1 Tax=Syntrophothermus sp. TaxID=2736299 RepID=UPI00257D0855|nr:hypothetical protein [Syntrophothermus sp.]NSW82533.1 hypothetical protein [Syntrophothermus sp.]